MGEIYYMATKKLNYVKSETVKKIAGDYILLLGERSNGKSYAVKNLCIEQAYQHERWFVYLRRYDLDCKDSQCEPYFGDVPVSTITKGLYDCITVFRKKIYMSNHTEDGTIKRGQCIGVCMALTNYEHYKSLTYDKVDQVIYEEFITDRTYLPDEPRKLQNLMSTIFRHRKGKCYLIGNKISRICPYFTEWQLTKIPRQEAGTIESYKVDAAVISVYMTHSLEAKSGLFFGDPARAITGGAWETETHAHLERPVEEYEIIYTAVLQYNANRFLMQVLQDPKGYPTWYIQPKTTDIQSGTRVISNQYTSDPMYTDGFIPLTQGEQRLFDLLDKGKIAFSDNLTGTEFIQCRSLLASESDI